MILHKNVFISILEQEIELSGGSTKSKCDLFSN